MEETGRIYEALGPRLVRLRQERGLSQQELARALHVTRQAVSNWERGKTARWRRRPDGAGGLSCRW